MCAKALRWGSLVLGERTDNAGLVSSRARFSVAWCQMGPAEKKPSVRSESRGWGSYVFVVWWISVMCRVVGF